MALLKNKQDLPDWFPLPIYKETLSEKEWLTELFLRFGLSEQYKYQKDTDKAKSAFISIFVDRERHGQLIENYPEPQYSWGVRHITNYEVAYIANMLQTTEKGSALYQNISNIREKSEIHPLIIDESDCIKEGKKTFFIEEVDWDNEPFEMTDVLPRMPVSIDIEQDDETLKLAFEVWLAGVRSVRGEAPKPIDQKDFEEWGMYQILAVFDLDIWASIHGHKFTDNLIASALWPDSDVDTTERLRKVARPKARAIFDSWGLIGRFWKQLEVEQGLEDVIRKKESESRNSVPESEVQ